MLELLAMIAAAVLIVWTPIEARKVAGGWVRARHKGTPGEFRLRYRRQLTVLVWAGVAIGAGNILLSLLVDADRARSLARLAMGVLWLGVSGAAVFGRRIMDAAPR